MDTDSSVPPPSDPARRFAAARHELAHLLDLDASQRAGALEALRAQDAELASCVAALLAHVDERDLQPPPDDAAPGRCFGPFRVLRLLGRGGMGEVFLAERTDPGLEQRVALKRVRQTLRSDELDRRFLRERQLLARLQHPGIARLIDGGIGSDGRAWLAMEFVEGRSLLEHARAKALSIESRVELMRRVCAAVAYAHRNLVVHRDLKPANVMVSEEGEPRLLDFGIAKLLDDSELDATRTALRAMTLRYAAPEQVAGDRTTTATDVHALGVLLYELVAEASPFARAQAGEVDWHRAILDDAPRALADALASRRAALVRALWSRVVGDLERILRKAMAKRASDRYAGVVSLDGDLEDWLAQRPLRSGIGSARAQTRYLLSRYRWPLLATGGILLALLVGAALALQQAQRAREQSGIARDNLDALLGVLGSGNPGIFAGREPSAGEFLAGAAGSLAQRERGNPTLLRRALLEIGHALINLGHADRAEAVLQQASDAAGIDPEADDGDRADILGLLIVAQDRADAYLRAGATAARIETLAQAGTLDAATAVDALARAAGVLAKSGDADASQRLFERAQARLAEVGSVSVRENYWRQRGWTALRADRNATALDALQRALQEIDAAPAQFAPLRRAEGELLLGEAQLALGDSSAAAASIARARPVLLQEYAAGHPERAAIALTQARLALLQGEVADSLARLAAAEPALRDAGPDYARDRFQRLALLARAEAEAARCGDARRSAQDATRALSELHPRMPRETAAATAMHATLRRRCADEPLPSAIEADPSPER
jgi:serine/threonine protein kinase